MTKRLLLILPAVLLAGHLAAQTATPVFQTLTCVKAQPGKLTEYRDFVTSNGPKLAKVAIDAGSYNTWTLLQSVRPNGEEARCDFEISTLSEGAPPEPNRGQGLAEALSKAGIKMSAADYLGKRDATSHLVSQEIWVMRIRVGTPKKGNYVFQNYMKVKDAAGYSKFENDIWRPMAEGWVQEGSQSAWVLATRFLPSGTDLPYAAYSADIYPDWASVFKSRSTQAVFEKVHTHKDYQDTMSKLGTLRDLARRDLYVIVDRVSKM
jgi:hypothetical protein